MIAFIRFIHFRAFTSVLWQRREFHLYNTLILNMKTVTLVCNEDVIKEGNFKSCLFLSVL